jgi:hypothetical protein
MDISQIWDLIHAIENGSVTLTPTASDFAYCGNIEYTASNGWRVIVFSDCEEWDYFDRFVSPTGEILDFAGMPEDLQSYHPPDFALQRYKGFELNP